MKQYTVKLDTILLGRPVLQGDIVNMSDDAAKAYKRAGLIEDVKDETTAKDKVATKSEK